MPSPKSLDPQPPYERPAFPLAGRPREALLYAERGRARPATRSDTRNNTRRTEPLEQVNSDPRAWTPGVRSGLGTTVTGASLEHLARS